MVQGVNFFTFNIFNKKPNLPNIVKIALNNKCITSFYKEALLIQQAQASTYGFIKGETPLHYIDNTYKTNIIEHLKNLFFNHCIMNFLCQSICANKIIIAGDPVLIDVDLDIEKDGEFFFGVWSINDKIDDKWKKISLKAPGRKNYKDIDKQVETFIKEEVKNTQNGYNPIAKGDWVSFDMQIVNNNKSPIIEDYKDSLWVKISKEEGDRELHELFLGKNIDDVFFTKNLFLQDYISNDSNIKYNISVHIKDYVPHDNFSLDLFKNHFQLKTTKDMHSKFIEVFSYRNDLSQRRETIEVTLKLLLKQYYIQLPAHLLERQKKLVLSAVHNNPDYNVYKSQKDFKDKIRLLAERQLKESVIIDAISYQENISVSSKDILSYLNLMHRQRTREFIYFKIPQTRFNGQEIPISYEILKLYCLREKTLNYIINYLTKKNK